MTKETRFSIWIVAMVLIVVMAGFWLLGGSRDSDDSTPSLLEKSLVSPDGIASDKGLPPSNSSSGTIEREGENDSHSSQSGTSDGAKTPVDSNQANDTSGNDTFQIIVREPVTVDGVDVGQVLQGKVINSEDEVVNKSSD